MEDRLVFVGAKRTPFGTFGGRLRDLSATDLGVLASKATLEDGKVDPADIDHVVFGNVLQTSTDAAYLARHIGLKVGAQTTTPCVTINRLCGSGFEAIAYAARLIQTGAATTVLAGGAESMSQAPYVLRKARFGYRLGNGQLEDMLMSGLYDTYPNMPMAETAQKLADQYQITRKECDEYALLSHQRASTATKNGLLKEEISPVQVKHKKETLEFLEDEHIRHDCTYEGLAKLKPAFRPESFVTAGNASGICDGAAAVLLTKESAAKNKGWPILGEWLGSEVVGVDPTIMGIGPVPASKKLLSQLGVSWKEIAAFEINEAFAPQYLAVEKELELNRQATNKQGGAIALGHPLAASGTRLLSHLLYSLRQNNGGLGLASACIGGGQGMAVLIKV